MTKLWEWHRYVSINPRHDERQMAKLSITMSATGPELSLRIGDGPALTLATKWNIYTTDHSKELIDAINEGLAKLRETSA